MTQEQAPKLEIPLEMLSKGAKLDLILQQQREIIELLNLVLPEPTQKSLENVKKT